MRRSLLFLQMALLIVTFCAGARNSRAAPEPFPVATVRSVDLPRYMGLWYEIARFDHFFQKGCFGSSATYSLLPDGEVEVVNRCVNDSDGTVREAKGRAWSVDPGGNARLKVSFFWPFRTDYWIIDLGKEYEYAVVGDPKRQYLWILSRRPVMEEAVYRRLLDLAERQGFAVERLIRRPLPRNS